MRTDQPNTSPTAPRRAPSVQIAFRTLGRTLRHGYDNLGTLLLTSIFWYAGAILILPIGIVTAALHRMTKPMSEERAVDWRTFASHFRQDLGWSSKLAGTLLLGFIVLLINVRFYNLITIEGLRLLASFFIVLVAVWVCVTVYAFPVSLRQEDQSLWRTLRNTGVIALANLPGAVVSLILLLVLCVIFLVIPPLFLIIPGVVALWGQENVRMLLVASGYLPEDPFADRPRRKK